ncbi:zinc finger protein 503-like [Sebastes fasciatus]|uniref:zinc finger protein 503-like n=1 Tax=Sebastes fasciatus TaxID=394691 RepID=UPI003D9EEE46
MITSPTVSVLRNSTNPAWESGSSSVERREKISQLFFHHNFVSPADPSRQASRLPIKVLKMLTARSGHILHPEYLQPLPSTPISPIELDAKKSPLALLAQTCSQIGKPDPPSSSKLSSVTSNGSNSDKETKSGPLKMSDIGADDKSSFKPYSKSEKKDSSSSSSLSGDKTSFRVPSATCQPFSPRTGSPSSCTSASPLPAEGKAGDKEDKKESDSNKSTESNGSHRISGNTSDGSQHQENTSKTVTSDSTSVTSSSSSILGSGLVAPVSPYKPGHTVFPMPPAGISYPGSLAGAYAGYSQQFLPHGLTLDPTKSSSQQLLSAQFAAAQSMGCSKAGSSPLNGASPPTLMSASLCRDPYCLSYHCSSHLSAASANCAHDSAAAALKSGYPLMYQTHPLHGVHTSAPTFTGHPLYPYGFMLPNDPLPHVCNWVSANGPCDKRFSSSEELLGHLRTHTAFAGTEKLISGYPGSSSLANAAAAAAMACHMHMPPNGPGSPGALALRGPHHHLGLSSRYHPYSKSPLPPGAPVPVPAATGAYYSPYALYGQRLTTASALGYQ